MVPEMELAEHNATAALNIIVAKVTVRQMVVSSMAKSSHIRIGA
jgi:hypothetical protein